MSLDIITMLMCALGCALSISIATKVKGQHFQLAHIAECVLWGILTGVVIMKLYIKYNP